MEVAAEKIGVSKTSVARWENGEQKPRGASLDLVCAAYEMSAEELGLVNDEIVSRYDEQIFAVKNDFSVFLSPDAVERRSFLQTMLRTASIVLFLPPEELLRHDAQTAIVEAIKHPARIDNNVLDNLEVTTRYYWNVRANFTSSTLLNILFRHFQMLITILYSSHTSNIYKRLHSITGEIAQIIAQVLFDMKEYSTAWSYYIFSTQAAQRSHNMELWTVGLGRIAQLLLYIGQFQEALSYIQQAKQIPLSNTKVRCWLLVVEAEIYSRMQQRVLCFQSIDTARNIEIDTQDEDHYSIGLNISRLESYTGICSIHLHLPEQALVALAKAASLCDSSAKRRYSIILTDQAAAYVQLGNIDDACKTAEQALDLTVETKSAQVLDRIQTVQRSIKQRSVASKVKGLDEKIKSASSIIAI